MSEKKRILIVDDSASLRRIVHQALAIFEVEVVEADGAKSAFAQLALAKTDLILLDWHMPEQDGLSFFLEMQENPAYKDIPVIMLTAEDRKDSMLKAIRTGIRHYLTKPFTHEDLLIRVVQLLKLE